MADRLLDRAGQLARRRPVELAAALLAIAAVSVWVYSGVRSALTELVADNLHSLVDSQAATVDTWIGEKRLNVQRWAADPRLAAAAEPLLTAAAHGDDELRRACGGAPGARLIAAIDTLRQPDLASAVHLFDRDGHVLAARNPAKCGLPLHAAMQATFAKVLAGETVFTGSRSDAERVAAPGLTPGPPQVWIAAPVRDADGAVVAVLDIGKPADERFSQLFTAVQSGYSGEAYAFDAGGRLLSASRFRLLLEETGRIKLGGTPVGSFRLTDPGVDAPEPPLTEMIRRALALRAQGAASGDRLQPYRNYVGDLVIGAWRWLPEHDLGVAVEVAEREAFAPLLRLETAFEILGAAVGAAVFGLLVALLRILRMQQQVEEAQRVGNYELLEEIGQGGFARVYRARHRLLKRPTAVKIVELRLASDEMLARFDREARLASQLSHPNTVEIFDFGRTAEGQPFFAMEFLDGLTLQQVVERHGALAAPRAAHVLRGIAGSLAEAHAKGLVHRDIKPANVMLCRRGGEDDVVKVLDFGLAKDTRTEATRDLTRALRVLGTPSYMAPERIEHPDSADFRSDLYALGAVGSFLLRGAAPFAADNDLALAYQVVHAEPPPLPATVERLARLVQRCLEKSPDARPQSATEVIDALDAVLAQTPWTASEARAWWESRAADADGATQSRDLPITAS